MVLYFYYFKSKNYSLSVGKIGTLECDLLLGLECMNIFITKILVCIGFITSKNVNGINNVNIVDFIYNRKKLK